MWGSSLGIQKNEKRKIPSGQKVRRLLHPSFLSWSLERKKTVAIGSGLTAVWTRGIQVAPRGVREAWEGSRQSAGSESLRAQALQAVQSLHSMCRDGREVTKKSQGSGPSHELSRQKLGSLDWKVRSRLGVTAVIGTEISAELLSLRHWRMLTGRHPGSGALWSRSENRQGWPWGPLPRGSVGETFWQRIRGNQEVAEGRRALWGLLRWSPHSFVAP